MTHACYVTMPAYTMLYLSKKGSRCNPNRNPTPIPVHKELSTGTYQDCDSKGSRCNPTPIPVHKELPNGTYQDCDTKGSRCNPNPIPVLKELSTVTHQDCDTKSMVCNELLTYRNRWHKGHGAQRAQDTSRPVQCRVYYRKGGHLKNRNCPL